MKKTDIDKVQISKVFKKNADIFVSTLDEVVPEDHEMYIQTVIAIATKILSGLKGIEYKNDFLSAAITDDEMMIRHSEDGIECRPEKDPNDSGIVH